MRSDLLELPTESNRVMTVDAKKLIAFPLIDEIVFQLALIAVVQQIHTRIDSVVLHLRIRRNIRPPLLRIVAEEVVAPARQRLVTCDLGSRVGANELHPQRGSTGGIHHGVTETRSFSNSLRVSVSPW